MESRLDMNLASLHLNLYIIRHGETEWSLSHQHTGRTDIPLDEEGESEARKLGERLATTPFSHVFTSPMQRAQKTCELAGLGATAKIEADLAEWDYGNYEGRRTIDICKDRPDWNIYRDGCPNGETPSQISDRADRLISVLRYLEGNVALFSHGHIGCVLADRWIGLSVREGPHFLLGTSSLGILSYDPDRPGVPVIARWNGRSHLESASVYVPLIGDSIEIRHRAEKRWQNESGEIPNVLQIRKASSDGSTPK
jgi:broad specificity phosphatase PhoE